MLVGDFNDYRESPERTSRSVNDSMRIAKFNNNINYCELIDLEYSGPKFTWCNGRVGGARTYVRLDKVLVNTEWSTKYKESSVKTLTKVYLDYSLLFIRIDGKNSKLFSLHPFRFEAC